MESANRIEAFARAADLTVNQFIELDSIHEYKSLTYRAGRT